MRRRSDAGQIADAMLAAPVEQSVLGRLVRDALPAEKASPFLDALRAAPTCPVTGCGKPIYRSPGGMTCSNGHGGVVEIDERLPIVPEPPTQTPPGPDNSPGVAGPTGPGPAVPLFASANKGAGINPDMQRIVEAIYRVDASVEYQDLESNLEVGDQRGDYGTLLKHLDKAERRARTAHQLFLGMRLERKRWELDADDVTASMREKAVAALEKEKLLGDKTKRITNDDVDAQIRQMFRDEFRAQSIKRVQLAGAEAQLERDADLWKARCHTLGTMISTLRK